MTWIYKDEPLEEIPEGSYSFVYLITNLIDGRKYIGKKLFWFTKTKVVKGKRKKVKSESDWRDYWSSSEELKGDIQKLGKENFRREILHICPNKGTASYMEAKEQMINEVLEHPDLWYNGQIQVRVHRNHIKK
jgi:hypothetical protein